MTRSRPPVLLIGLDAADIDLVQRLCDRGTLPTLRSLMDRGCLGRLEGIASRFAGGVWPTFYLGRDVPCTAWGYPRCDRPRVVATPYESLAASSACATRSRSRPVLSRPCPASWPAPR